MAWQRAAAVSELRPEGVTGVEVAGTPVALYSVDGTVYATHGICTHQFAYLADGFVEDGCIECPLHQALFDIRTGEAKCAPASEPIRTYAVRIEGDQVLIDLEQPAGIEAASGSEVAGAAEPAPATKSGALERIVIIGAGQAGARAAEAVRAAGFEGTLTLVGEEQAVPYERPPLSKAYLLGEAARDTLPVLSPTAFEALALDYRPGVRATRIERATKTVSLSDGAEIAYDKLLIATGARARRLDVPGADLEGVHTLRTVADAEALGPRLVRGARLVIVGGGFIGLEVASSARSRGCAVTVLEREERLLERLMPEAGSLALRKLAERHGVDLRFGARVDRIERKADGLVVHGADGTEVAADVVVVAIGAEPNLELAADAGLEIRGGVVVDGQGRTSDPDIFAAGDVALCPSPPAQRSCRLESWQNAQEQAASAGRSMAGQPTPYQRTPWFWTDQFGLNIQIIGQPSAAGDVAVRGEPGERGSVIYSFDEGRLKAAIAFDDANAIREARKLIASGTAVSPGELGARPFPDRGATETDMNAHVRSNGHAPNGHGANGAAPSLADYRWPEEGLTRIPDWVYVDDFIYQREIERIFKGRTWNYVALECEVPNPGDYIRSNVGPVPVVVSRAEDGGIHVFENRCSHRAAEFCRELSGNAKEFVCPYHQWSYDLKGNLAGVPFRRGVNGKGGMPKDFRTEDHGLTKLNVTTHRGVVFASYVDDMESFQDYLGPEVLAEFEATFDGRKPRLLGYYRHTLPGNWKLYHENLKDPYHATLLHTFLVTFGLLVAGNRSLMLADPSGRHGVMASAKSDASKVSSDAKKEMRAYREGMTLHEPRFMDFVDEFDSPWSVTMATIWPNLIVQREMNTLGVRQIVPTGPHEFIMKWTMFGFEGDDEEMTRHRLRQGNLMGPAGFLGLEDNEAIKFVQDGMQRVPNGGHLVELDPETEAGTSETLISEAAIRAMYRHWREAMGL